MKNKNYYAVLNVNDRCMDFDCRCNRVKFMDGFVVFQEHTNENDVTLAIIPCKIFFETLLKFAPYIGLQELT